jgi:iron uptake system EfeUOB component EfeO/EfeM
MNTISITVNGTDLETINITLTDAEVKTIYEDNKKYKTELESVKNLVYNY